MHIKTGIDMVKRKRFENSAKKGGQAFLEKIFLPQELRQNTSTQLASIFCVKEALIKALDLKPGAWLTISTNRQQNGKVRCSLLDPALAKTITNLDTSIAHDGAFIVAVALVVLH